MLTRMSRRAEMDLAEITNFIALDNPARAFAFEEELLEHARRIGRAPLAYAKTSGSGRRIALVRPWCLCDLPTIAALRVTIVGPATAADSNDLERNEAHW